MEVFTESFSYSRRVRSEGAQIALDPAVLDDLAEEAPSLRRKQSNEFLPGVQLSSKLVCRRHGTLRLTCRYPDPEQ